jgi:hypothetical protein
MTLRLGALHDALLDPGNAEKAVRAAEEVAGYENRLSHIESRLTLLTWMMGVVIILLSGLFWQGFTIMGRLPR